MRAELGQTVVPENVGGAGGSTGIGRARPRDGGRLTIGIGIWSAMVVTARSIRCPTICEPTLGRIALLAQAPQLVVTKKTFPANDLEQLIAWLKANPDKATTGIAGAGSPPDMSPQCCSSR